VLQIRRAVLEATADGEADLAGIRRRGGGGGGIS
jgi:hypothetical protein